jgi:hypothetical protein
MHLRDLEKATHIVVSSASPAELRRVKINVFVTRDACLRAEGNDLQPSFERGE